MERRRLQRPSLAYLAEAINRTDEDLNLSARTTIELAIKFGQLLTQAKEQVAHGGWLPWLEANTSISDRRAQKYMRLAKHAAALNTPSTAHLGIEDALKLLAEPPDKERRLDELAQLINHEGPIEAGEATLGPLSDEDKLFILELELARAHRRKMLSSEILHEIKSIMKGEFKAWCEEQDADLAEILGEAERCKRLFAKPHMLPFVSRLKAMGQWERHGVAMTTHQPGSLTDAKEVLGDDRRWSRLVGG